MFAVDAASDDVYLSAHGSNQVFVLRDGQSQAFLDTFSTLLTDLLPRYRAEGKSYLTIAIGCTGGKHRSVVVAEKLAARLVEKGYRAHLSHRDVEAE